MLGFCKRLESKMSIKAYDWAIQRQSDDGENLWSFQKDGKFYIKFKDVEHELTDEFMIADKGNNVFYPMDKDEFYAIYDGKSKNNNVYKRKVSGVLAYNPEETELDELGKRLFFYEASSQKQKYIIRNDRVEKLAPDSFICKNIFGVLCQIPKDQFLLAYEV